MTLRRAAYGLHRWLALVVSLQLLAWSVGGLAFSVMEIEAVRGERSSVGPVTHGLDAGSAAIGAGEAIRVAREAGEAEEATGEIASVVLVDRGLGARFELRAADGRTLRSVDAQTGRLCARLSRDEAERVALADFVPEAHVSGARLIERDLPGEARGRALPLWCVELDHASGMRIYVDAVSGEVVARRNRIWRLFDFFWMLHIMDYAERENFNHPLLTTFAVLAVATSATGLGLWGWRAARWARRRRAVRRRPSTPGG